MAEKRDTRRAMLTGGAVLVGAAVVGSAGTAEAANGNPLLIGKPNAGSAETKLTNSGATPALNVTSTNAAHAALLTARHQDRWGVFAVNEAKVNGNAGAIRADGRQNHGLSAGTANYEATAITARNTAGGGSPGGRAILATSHPDAQARLDEHDFFKGAGEFGGLNGVIGVPTVANGAGVLGIATVAQGIGVAGVSEGTGKALVGFGDAVITGTVTKGAGAFRIDHPLDPANKYLLHSFVESPDMLNVYNGNVTADASGEATVELPDWFEALNKDFRYQLTPIGGAAPDLHVKAKVADGTFEIGGAKPGQEISWLVTGIRHDAYADAHRIPTEEAKPATEKGTYLFPEGFGKPASAGMRPPRAR